ncbi:glycosyltransferase family 2 protein [Polynucleobacter paneuropaeus]|nr:glycosyltransferase family 2 protein [Polynucleobacter paneuropaeus]MBT8585665.1 glycosyltransferase family 2 protein [Polynucleobacter paneuropaeus]
MNLIDSHADLISVVIPTKNRAQRLIKAIASAQQQIGVALEILIVDDASTDTTESEVRSLADNDSRIKYFRHYQSAGGGAARNTGIENSTGALVAFLDDDDEWYSNKLKVQLELLKSQPSAVAASCSFLLNKPGQNNQLITITSLGDRQKLLRSNHLGGASVCLAWRKVLIAIGGLDPLLRSCQDWDLWLKLHKQGSIEVSQEPLVNYYVHEEDRITGNLSNEYQGRKKIFLRYRKEMNSETRKHTLAILMFYRVVVYDQSLWRRLKTIFYLILRNKNLESIKFIYRFIKLYPSIN